MVLPVGAGGRPAIRVFLATSKLPESTAKVGTVRHPNYREVRPT